MTPEELKVTMKQHSLNVKQAASWLSVSEKTVYAWMSGRRNMPKLAWEHLKILLEKRPEKETLFALMNRR